MVSLQHTYYQPDLQMIGTAISNGKRKSYKTSTAAWQRSRDIKLSHAMQLPPCILHFRSCSPWAACLEGFWYLYNLGIVNWWESSYEPFMPFPRSIASKLPQESPEHTTLLLLGRYPYLAYVKVVLMPWRSWLTNRHQRPPYEAPALR